MFAGCSAARGAATKVEAEQTALERRRAMARGAAFASNGMFQ
jgi:hypothetical protein